MSWFNRFSKNMFMALASKGRHQLACECENYNEWSPGEYMSGSVVLHTNPSTSELSLYVATGIFGDEHHTDHDDVPGISIHWELVCSCKEIGFPPTPSPTPILETPSPTPVASPTPIPSPTPSPTPQIKCSDYEEWAENFYEWNSRVMWNGRIYEARDYEGAEPDDMPGVSNHWKLIFLCPEWTCCQSGEQMIGTAGEDRPVVHGEQGVSVQGMDLGGTMCCPYPKYPGLPASWPILIEGQPKGLITIPMGKDGVEFGEGFPSGADEIYYSYDNKCYSGKINNYSYGSVDAINLKEVT